jgi:phosphoribosylglycinamide formyltransferase 2
MQIGTPLSPSATRVMLLGAGELGKEVIIALQRLGVEVIAVDRYDGAPGHQVAHRQQTIDMSDGNVLARLIDSEKPAIVVPEIEAIATETLLELEKAGVCKVIPTARAANLTMNREGIRRLAAGRIAAAHLPLRLRRFLRRVARSRGGPGRHWLSLHPQAGHVLVGQGPEPGGRAG